MDQIMTNALTVDFARNSLGDFLSKHYPQTRDAESVHPDGMTFTLYVESGADKWHVHGISEIEQNPETEGLTLAGRVQVSDEEELLTWFPAFDQWVNATLPESFVSQD